MVREASSALGISLILAFLRRKHPTTTTRTSTPNWCSPKSCDPTMLEHVKLFFLWPCLCHGVTHHTRDQGPKTFNDAILIAQCIEACTLFDSQPRCPPPPLTDLRATPMDIVQNVQLQARYNLPNCDARGHPMCFYYNNYGHVRGHC